MESYVVILMLVSLMCLSLVPAAFADQPMDAGLVQAQIDALGDSGGVVKLEAGTYLMKKPLKIATGVTLQGAGRDETTLLLADGVDDSAVTTHQTHDIVIRDLTIDGNGRNQKVHAGCAVMLSRCYNYRIENVRVKNGQGYAGIYTNVFGWEKDKLRKNYLINTIVEGSVRSRVPDPGWREGATHYGHGIYITSWDNDNVLIKGCVTRNNAGSGIFIEDQVLHAYVEDCESYDNAQNGIWLASAFNCVVRNNKIYGNNQRGIESSWFCAQNYIAANEIYNNGLEGIFLGTPDTIVLNTKPLRDLGITQTGMMDALRDQPAGRNLVLGNVIRNNNQHKIDAVGGIHVLDGRNFIAYNYCYDDQDEPTQCLGIRVASDYNTVVDNYLRHNQRGEIDLDENALVGNVVVPWDYSKPWTPETLVGKF